jgi:hypothetical protein
MIRKAFYAPIGALMPVIRVFVPLLLLGLAVGCPTEPPVDDAGENDPNNPADGGNNPGSDSGRERGDECTEERRGVTVIITNTQNGGRVCSATVTATDAEYAEVLTPFGLANECIYFGLFNRPGSYTLNASAPNYQSTSGNVTITGDDCGVPTETQEVSMMMTPQPGFDAGPPMDAGNDPVDAGNDPVDAGDDPVDAGNDPVDAGNDPVDAGNDPVDAGDAG